MDELCILEIRDNGTYLNLKDGSKWLVAEGDYGKAQEWLPAERVRIYEVDEGGEYPYRIRNIDACGVEPVRANKLK